MFTELIALSLSGLLFFALHVLGNGSFPKPLSAKEEKETIEKIQQGDKEAIDKLTVHNLRLVAHIVKKYYASSKDQEDLISIGSIGLIKAVHTFKPDKNIRFSTYASRCIENEILMHFRGLKKSSQNMYMSDPIDVDKNGNPLTLLDIIASDIDLENEIETKVRGELAKELIEEVLSPREKIIIKLRFGIEEQIPLTQREVAQRLNISRSYVSRIEKKALNTLKKQFK